MPNNNFNHGFDADLNPPRASVQAWVQMLYYRTDTQRLIKKLRFLQDNAAEPVPSHTQIQIRRLRRMVAESYFSYRAYQRKYQFHLLEELRILPEMQKYEQHYGASFFELIFGDPTFIKSVKKAA